MPSQGREISGVEKNGSLLCGTVMRHLPKRDSRSLHLPFSCYLAYVKGVLLLQMVYLLYCFLKTKLFIDAHMKSHD